MAVGLSLPEDAQWVSEICLDKNVLSIRLVPVVIDANVPCAYVLNVHEVADPASAITFLKKICTILIVIGIRVDKTNTKLRKCSTKTY